MTQLLKRLQNKNGCSGRSSDGNPDQTIRSCLILSPQSPNFSAMKHWKKPGELSCRQPESLGWTPPSVYVMNKTGRIVTEQNMGFLGDSDLQEWNDAVDEYHQMFRSGNTQ